MGINIEPPDWVDSDNHLIDRNNLKNHTDQYIRQLLTATFDEFFRRILMSMVVILLHQNNSIKEYQRFPTQT